MEETPHIAVAAPWLRKEPLDPDAMLLSISHVFTWL